MTIEITEDLIKSATAVAREGGSLQTIAQTIRVSDRTLDNWMAKGRDGEEPYRRLYDEIRYATGQYAREMHATIRFSAAPIVQRDAAGRAMKDENGKVILRPGDPKSAMFWLSKRDRTYVEAEKAQILREAEQAMDDLIDSVHEVLGRHDAARVFDHYTAKKSQRQAFGAAPSGGTGSGAGGDSGTGEHLQ